MSNDKDIRWLQRLGNYQKAFGQLELGVKLALEKELSDLEREGLIQRFEYTQELAWQTIRDFYVFLGETGIQGSRDAFHLAIQRGLVAINDGKVFMETIRSRNRTVHTYNEKVAREIMNAIVKDYYQAFATLLETLEKEKQNRGF